MARHGPESLAHLARQCGWRVWQQRDLNPVVDYKSLVAYRPGWDQSAYACWVDGRVRTARVRFGYESGPALSVSKLVEHLEANPAGDNR